ncbi:hypothetical protein [Kineosporia succinea]|uniref:Small secreted hydrophilic protein n=1 Tax=Kineosporia succinea TaxID=84632 RepID=A0ABT9P132_9ACTN|nr:hypothetical protein [Kineosporia succinea]MDP9826276.1 hypothetical protein [Kineosporia succinea]
MGRRHLLITAVLLGAAGLAVPVVAAASTSAAGPGEQLGPAVVASLDAEAPGVVPTPKDVTASSTPVATPDAEKDEADDGDDRADRVAVPAPQNAGDDDDENEPDEDEPDEDEPDEDGDDDSDDSDDD